MSLSTLRRLFEVFDAEVSIVIRWRGGELDRLIDRRHSELGGHLMATLDEHRFTSQPGISFSTYGERGSIDALAWHAPSRTLLVIEVKTELTSIEETIRVHDMKARLAPAIARERFGWDVQAVARILVLPDDRTVRRQVERHDAVLSRAYPMRGRELRRWMAEPAGAVSGLIFLSAADESGTRRRIAPVRRVRRAASGDSAAETRRVPT